MVKLRICASLFLRACLAAAMLAPGLNGALGAECKRKTAGFYLLDANPSAERRLAVSLQSMPSSLTGGLGDPERGRELVANRQKGDCLSCHKLSLVSNVADQGAIGAPLDGIGGRYSDAQLRQVLVQPQAYFPDTIMPSYYKAEDGAASILTAAEVEDLVAYLRTLK
ncbi:MAG: sulfur oxidation c-type cytochrome SoxX [Rhodomicrobium sp.]|jgi:sulfur-oxidizing protein SoxX